MYAVPIFLQSSGYCSMQYWLCMLSRTFVIKKLEALGKSNCAALPKRTSAVERKAEG